MEAGSFDAAASDAPAPDAEPPKPWKPKPGEMCTIVMPDEAGITNKTWKAVWVIPTDMAALVDHMDYLRARDGAGPMNLVRAHRAVWTDDRGMRDVKYIAEGAVPGAAKVRLGTGAYKADSDGGMSKDLGYQAPGVEAMISLFWLVKQD